MRVITGVIVNRIEQTKMACTVESYRLSEIPPDEYPIWKVRRAAKKAIDCTIPTEHQDPLWELAVGEALKNADSFGIDPAVYITTGHVPEEVVVEVQNIDAELPAAPNDTLEVDGQIYQQHGHGEGLMKTICDDGGCIYEKDEIINDDGSKLVSIRLHFKPKNNGRAV